MLLRSSVMGTCKNFMMRKKIHRCKVERTQRNVHFYFIALFLREAEMSPKAMSQQSYSTAKFLSPPNLLTNQNFLLEAFIYPSQLVTLFENAA